MEEKEITLNELARMIADGFEDVTSRMATKDDMREVNRKLDLVESGQEDIKLRIDSLAYKFEVKELAKRVDVLEKKVGIAPV